MPKKMEPIGAIIERNDLLDLPVGDVVTHVDVDPLGPVTQGDVLYSPALREERSLASGLSFVGLEDKARQEFRDDADINKLLSRYGVDTPSRVPTFGEADYDLDLQGAYAAAREFEDAYEALPQSLRDRYTDPASLLNAVSHGQLVLDMSPNVEPVPAPAPSSSAPPVTPPSTEVKS